MYWKQNPCQLATMCKHEQATSKALLIDDIIKYAHSGTQVILIFGVQSPDDWYIKYVPAQVNGYIRPKSSTKSFRPKSSTKS